MKIKINWEHKRVKHAIERMWLRGISTTEILNAIKMGQKRKQLKSGLFEAFYSYYSIVYDEKYFKEINIRKIYPITIKVW